MTTVSGAGVVVTGGGTEAVVAQLAGAATAFPCGIDVIEPGQVAGALAAAMDAGRCLVLPHPDGLIRPLVGERLSFADVPDALRRLGAGKTAGRLVPLP